MKSERGFEVQHFSDDNGIDCSIQESSSVVPCIWLGVHRPRIYIAYKDAKAAGLDLKKDCPETNDYGVCTIPIPEKAFIESRMHLNRKQARELAKKLNYFARTGILKRYDDEQSTFKQ